MDPIPSAPRGPESRRDPTRGSAGEDATAKGRGVAQERASVAERSRALDALVSRAGLPSSQRSALRATGVPANRRGLALVVVACVVATAAGLLAWRWVARPAPLEDRLTMATEGGVPGGDARGATGDGPAGDSAPGGAPGGAPGAPQSTDGAAAGEVVVHVTGAVGAPGVVRLAEGARVVDAVTAAGGLRPEADAQRLNLAAPLLDGSRIVVPVVGQEMPPEVTTTVAAQAGAAPVAGSASPGGATPTGAKLDLNSATAEQLEFLPGVGPATAAAIVEHREAHGEFGSVDELLDVRGIGDAKLEGLRDLVVAG